MVSTFCGAAPVLDATAPMAIASGEADNDTFTTSEPHGLVSGDKVTFSVLTGGSGLSVDTPYYVISAGLTATTFRLSATRAAVR